MIAYGSRFRLEGSGYPADIDIALSQQLIGLAGSLDGSRPSFERSRAKIIQHCYKKSQNSIYNPVSNKEELF